MPTLHSMYEAHLDFLNTKRISAHHKNLDMMAFRLCSYVGDTPLEEITYDLMKEWFNTLTYHQQCKAKMALERFFDEMLVSGKLPNLTYNPFGKGTGKLWMKDRPVKMRQRLLAAEYKAIRDQAIADECEWFVRAMDLAYLLKLRRADVITLKFSHLNKERTTLSKTIIKSLNQKGADKAYTLVWDLTEPYGKEVAGIIKQARTSRRIDLGRKVEVSPYIVHYRPLRVAEKPASDKTHHTQVTDQNLSRTFEKYRKAVPSIAVRCEAEGTKPPTFHEIRSLSARNDQAKGMSKEDVAKALAHTIGTVTDLYLDEQTIRVTSRNSLGDVV